MCPAAFEQIAEPMTTQTQPDVRDMTPGRRAFISVLLLFYIGGQMFDVILKREDWPFSNYPMYSGVRGSTISREEVVGVTAGGEITLKPSKHFAPLDNTRFQRVLKKIRHKHHGMEYQEALRQLFGRYEELRSLGKHKDPPLLGLRSYQMLWKLQSGARNRDKPDKRRLQFYVHQAPPDVADRLTREASQQLTPDEIRARQRVSRSDIVINVADLTLFGRAHLVPAPYASEEQALYLSEKSKAAPKPEPKGYAEIEVPRAKGTYQIWLRGQGLPSAHQPSLWVQVVAGGTIACDASIEGMGNWWQAFPPSTFGWSSAAPGAPPCIVTVTERPLRLRLSARAGRILADQIWLTRKPREVVAFAEPVVLAEPRKDD